MNGYNTDSGYRLAAAIDALNADLPAVLDDIAANQPQLCELLHALREQRIRLAELEATVEAKAARSMGPADRIEWDGYYAERKGGAKRSHWDHKRLAARVTEQSYVDAETGEVDTTAQALTTEVVGELLGAAAISYWRTTILRSMGVAYDDAVETERGRRTVHVTKGSASSAIDALAATPSRKVQRRSQSPLPPPNPLLAATVDGSPAVPLS